MPGMQKAGAADPGINQNKENRMDSQILVDVAMGRRPADLVIRDGRWMCVQTTMFVDPHEIANVFGLRGVRLMVDEAAGQPIHVWVQVPSCVPSAPGLETPGASIGPADVAEAMSWPGIIGLGEMMNYPGVIMADERMHTEMQSARAAGKVIGGHYASPDLGLPFHGYAAGGPEDDHEGTRLEDAVAQVKAVGRKDGAVSVNVIGIIENQAPTRHLKLMVPVAAGEIRPSPGPENQQDIAKIALIERHRGTGRVQVALVSGFGFSEKCAVASTVAHDCHHLLVIGTDEECMARAANRLAETGGGQVVVRDGAIIGEVRLPIAGLMSDERADIVAAQAASVLEGFRACGCTLSNPNMQLSLLALVVIPELRISDRGLVDVTRQQCIPVVEE